jgi:hypothetical protein
MQANVYGKWVFMIVSLNILEKMINLILFTPETNYYFTYAVTSLEDTPLSDTLLLYFGLDSWSLNECPGIL